MKNEKNDAVIAVKLTITKKEKLKEIAKMYRHSINSFMQGVIDALIEEYDAAKNKKIVV